MTNGGLQPEFLLPQMLPYVLEILNSSKLPFFRLPESFDDKNYNSDENRN